MKIFLQNTNKSLQTQFQRTILELIVYLLYYTSLSNATIFSPLSRNFCLLSYFLEQNFFLECFDNVDFFFFNHHFSEKQGQLFFQIFPNHPPHGVFIHPLVHQRKQEKLVKVSLWPKCLAKVSLAKLSPAKVTLAKLSLAKVSLAKMSLWAKCYSGTSVRAEVFLAKVSFQPKCDSAKQSFRELFQKL